MTTTEQYTTQDTSTNYDGSGCDLLDRLIEEAMSSSPEAQVDMCHAAVQFAAVTVLGNAAEILGVEGAEVIFGLLAASAWRQMVEVRNEALGESEDEGDYGYDASDEDDDRYGYTVSFEG